MAVDGAAAYIMGSLYDKLKEKYDHHGGGLITLIILPVMSAIIPFLAFADNIYAAFGSAILLGIVMGAQETIMKAGIADITPVKKRGTGYGIFNFGFGLAMLAGGWLAGVLYEISIPVLCWSAAGVQAVALGIFFVMKKEIGHAV
jgi:predicted MFS family arabinose efflux permease